MITHTIIPETLDTLQFPLRPNRSTDLYCQDNNISLSVIYTKEMILVYRKRRTDHTPILIDGAVDKQDDSFMFLGVDITNNLT